MPGLLRGLARTALVAGTATAVSNRVSRRQAGRWAVEDAPPPPDYGPPSRGDERGDDTLEQLRTLGELRSQGVLTDQEFEDQKRRILRG